MTSRTFVREEFKRHLHLEVATPAGVTILGSVYDVRTLETLTVCVEIDDTEVILEIER
jgi:hypothetical protein